MPSARRPRPWKPGSGRWRIFFTRWAVSPIVVHVDVGGETGSAGASSLQEKWLVDCGWGLNLNQGSAWTYPDIRAIAVQVSDLVELTKSQYSRLCMVERKELEGTATATPQDARPEPRTSEAAVLTMRNAAGAPQDPAPAAIEEGPQGIRPPMDAAISLEAALHAMRKLQTERDLLVDSLKKMQPALREAQRRER